MKTLTNACACGDCYHPAFGPNTDGEPCDYCRDCACPSADHGPTPVYDHLIAAHPDVAAAMTRSAWSYADALKAADEAIIQRAQEFPALPKKPAAKKATTTPAKKAAARKGAK